MYKLSTIPFGAVSEKLPSAAAPDERNDMEAGDLDRMESVTRERRDRSLFQAKLLASVLWEASAVLIDQLFDDVAELRSLAEVTRQDIAGSFVLSGLPPKHAEKDPQQFLVIATDMAGALIRECTHPSGVAPRSSVPAGQVEVIQDLYDLDLADAWRGRLEKRMLEHTDSEMLYQNAMDGFEGDVELNMQLGLAQWISRTGLSPSTIPAFRPSCADYRRPFCPHSPACFEGPITGLPSICLGRTKPSLTIARQEPAATRIRPWRQSPTPSH